jgi:hypothetical protein
VLGAPAPGRPNGFHNGAFSAENKEISNDTEEGELGYTIFLFPLLLFFLD